jgi:hypothetical protein
VTNGFSAQPLRFRIEALMAAGPYDAPGNAILADFATPNQFPQRAAAQGVTAAVTLSKDQVKTGSLSGCLTAASTRKDRAGSWAKLEQTFAPPRNLSAHQALGLWVHGDGLGEVLNVQLRSPQHLSNGIGDHYLLIDFTGWRYFELIEPEGERHALYQWPYGDIYSIYRESVNFGQVETLALWYNDLPPGKPVACYLGPIKALPLVSAKLANPAISIGTQTIRFPVEISSGSYLEFHGQGDCKLYGPGGELVHEVVPEGPIPMLRAGANEVRFQAQTAPGVSPRAMVTVIAQGEAIR